MDGRVRHAVDYWVKNQVLSEFLQKYLALGVFFQVEVLLCKQEYTLMRCYFVTDEEEVGGGPE